MRTKYARKAILIAQYVAVEAANRMIYSRALPEPILFNALPKSASSFIGDALATGLNARMFAEVGGGAWPEFFLNQRLIQDVARTKSITSPHVAAVPVNLVTIAEYFQRMVVHVRDPRQATLSYVHNCLKNEKTDPVVNKVLLLPGDFFAWPFVRQVDYHIDHHLPTLIAWIRGWVEAESNDGFPTKILFTCFEDFVRDKRAYVQEILGFYGIRYDRYDYHVIERKPKVREAPGSRRRNEKLFRKGLTDEWREVFTPQQQQRASAQIPQDLCSRFGWEQ